jgi:hypothetical protein
MPEQQNNDNGVEQYTKAEQDAKEHIGIAIDKLQNADRPELYSRLEGVWRDV